MINDDDEICERNYLRGTHVPLEKCPLPRWCQPQPPPKPKGYWRLESVKPKGNGL